MNDIIIKDTWEGNLKHTSLRIPKQQLVVLCGVSGSGKSTLAVDVLFNECQRQYLEAMGMQGIEKPHVERIQHASPSILISQNTSNNHNPRSYVGTNTDLYTDLRMIYEKLGIYPCPHCQHELKPYQCVEEVIKEGEDYHVYQYCPHCGKRMDKLTRSHFSYNTRVGACPHCQGLGEALTIHWAEVLDESLSLEDGAIKIWTHKYLEYQIQVFYQAIKHYGISLSPDTPIHMFDACAKHILLHGVQGEQLKQFFPDKVPPKTTAEGRFEGITPALWRKVQEKGNDHPSMRAFFITAPCPECLGERLNEDSRNVMVYGKRLPEISSYPIDQLCAWIETLKTQISQEEAQHVQVYLDDILIKCTRLKRVGLSYLSLERRMATLSGGEIQRLKLAAALDCELDGLLYILDEPTIGLHPKDTAGLMEILRELQHKGNSIIVIEHDPLFLTSADHIIEIGPNAGKYGGKVIFQGTYAQLLNETTPTATWLTKTPIKRIPRTLPKQGIQVNDATTHNLKHVSAHIPSHGLICVTGVSGSGKSTLVFDVIGNVDAHVQGLEHFDSIKRIDQSVVNRSSRSNVATYSGVYQYIRSCFAKQSSAKEQHIDAKAFSFNSVGGRCEHCEGLGYVVSNRLFFADAKVPCPTCLGLQFQDFILSIKYKGFSISDILHMEVRETYQVFEDKKIKTILQTLMDCGLDYLSLGQSLTTLSGGEAQRLKFAKELLDQTSSNTLYLIDEPTIGLHPQDVDHFLLLLQRIVDQGNTILVVEHNTQVMQASDYIIDMGFGGGIHGGNIIAQGTPQEVRQNKNSVTGAYL